MAREDYEDDLALIPNLTPLHNGSEVVGPDGYYYMGGVNNGLGLGHHGHAFLTSKAQVFVVPSHLQQGLIEYDMQSSQLDAMMDRDEPLPEGEVEMEEGDQLMAWFSDEEEEESVVEYQE
ncbi:hypothetical protein C8R45DRAFT_942165 [Mycena sanguinolenta]|nr:hypothetical protein C8R45DRAFT_942165 [Mycena sanguinolenta]